MTERTENGSNHNERVAETHQPLAVSGSLSLPTVRWLISAMPQVAASIDKTQLTSDYPGRCAVA